MPWDPQRPVPWRRLVKEWALFAVAMVAVFALLAKAPPASYIGLIASLPLYLAFGWVLAKFGYSRKTLAELRAERSASATPTPSATSEARKKPAPTKRTSTGPQRSSTKPRKR